VERVPTIAWNECPRSRGISAQLPWNAHKLEDIGIRVHCLALGGVDLTSSAGKMTMNVINAVAQFERDLLIERTQSGLARAKAEGKMLGRPAALSADQQAEVKENIKNGQAISAIARQFKTSRQTIMRVRNQG
jgi:putative DNA-invertase from lambdoid prophage Rac